MAGVPGVLILNELVLSGLVYGANDLVEFGLHSLSFEASLTLSADAIAGVRTDYHT